MAKQKKSRSRIIARRTSGERVVKLAPDVAAADEAQLESFRKKFGRDPGPSDPLLFDPDSDIPKPVDPEKVRLEMVELMSKAGLDPEFIYAYSKTGLMPSDENKHLLSEEDWVEWEAAITEYREKLRGRAH